MSCWRKEMPKARCATTGSISRLPHLARQAPASAERQLDLAISHERVAKALEALQRRAEAGEHQLAARQIRESLATK